MMKRLVGTRVPSCGRNLMVNWVDWLNQFENQLGILYKLVERLGQKARKCLKKHLYRIVNKVMRIL